MHVRKCVPYQEQQEYKRWEAIGLRALLRWHAINRSCRVRTKAYPKALESGSGHTHATQTDGLTGAVFIFDGDRGSYCRYQRCRVATICASFA